MPFRIFMGRLRLHILASSSKGNCSVVQDAGTGACAVIDAGICKRDFLAGLAACGISAQRIEALLVTHDHSDHVKGLGVCLRALARKGVRPPVYAADAVRLHCPNVHELAGTHEIRPLANGKRIKAGDLCMTPFPTSHDALSSCGFRIEARGDALGFMTDTGIPTPESLEALADCRILALEANHDAQMLQEGPYPYPLKKRIAGPSGHLSNAQTAELLGKLAWEGLEQVVALHLSEENNTPALACHALEGALAAAGAHATVTCAKPKGAVTIG